MLYLVLALVSLVTGGVVTSLIEFKLKYNFFDAIEDSLAGVEHALDKAKAKVRSLEAKL